MSRRETAEEAQARLQAILEAAVESIITTDEKGVVESFNAAAERMFGYPAREVIGQDVSLLMPAPYRGEHHRYIADYLRTGEKKVIGIGREIVGRRRDGTVFPIHLSISEVKVAGRRLFTGIVRDTTSLKAAEEALRRERDFAESLVANALAIVLVLDPEGRVLRCNRYLEELTGYGPGEIDGRDWFETFLPAPDRDAIRDVFRRTIREIDTSGTVNAIIARDGREREIRWSNRVLKDDAGEPIGVLAVGHDITELKKAQARLLQSERLAAIGEMITGLSHESRNALQQMEGCLEALAAEVRSRRRASDLVARLYRAQRQLRQLYDDTRAFAAPIHLDRRTCELDRLWRSTWADLAPAHSEREIALAEDGAGADLHCAVDPFAIGQVFRNIFDNAIEASPRGGRVTIRCGETVLDERPALEIVVHDEGPGFTPDEQAKVFEPFFTTKSRGTGLGMAIVKRIVGAHGGRIEARTAPAGGAEIVLALPRAAPPPPRS